MFNLRWPIFSFYCGLFMGILFLQVISSMASSEIGVQDKSKHPVLASDPYREKVLVISCDRTFPSYTMLNTEGAPAGLFIDIWRLWAKKTGQKIAFKFGEWDETIRYLKAGEADIHSGLFINPERARFLDFSEPFYESTASVFYPSRYGIISSIGELSKKKIGAIEGGETANFLRTQFPEFSIITYKDPPLMIRAALEGEVFAIADETQALYTILGHGGHAGEFARIKTALYLKKFVAAVLHGRESLLDKINRGFSAISPSEFANIERRWIPIRDVRYFHTFEEDIEFSVAEKAWKRNHTTIRMGVDSNFPPFEFFSKETGYAGIASDYVRLLGRRLGLEMKIVSGRSWAEMIKMGKAGELDAFSCAAKTPERLKYMRFTRPYLKIPLVIITQSKSPYIGGLSDLKTRSVGVVREYPSHEFIEKNHPTIKLYFVDKAADGLEAVASGKIYAFVENLATATYLMSKHGYLNLKVAASTPYDHELAFAIRNDWPELVSILNKSLDAINVAEQSAISGKWLTVKYEHEINPAVYWQLAFRVGGIMLVILVVVFFWNVQIRRREERFRGLTEHGMDITQAFTEDGSIVYQSPSHLILLGYNDNELLGQSVHDLIHPEDWVQWKQNFNLLLQRQGVQSFIHRFRSSDGAYRIFESNGINLIKNKALKALVINARDVTDRIKAETELQKAHAELESRVEKRTIDLTLLNTQLNKEIAAHRKAKDRILGYQDALRSLTSDLALTEERERRRIAVDLHDRVSQTLALCQIKLGLLKRDIPTKKSEDHLMEAIDLCKKAIGDTRTLTFEISPPTLYELGLEAALDELTEITERDYGIPAEFKDDGQNKPLDQDIKVTLYRAVGELIMNVVKHACAKKIRVVVQRLHTDVKVEVSDDGTGFDPAHLFDRAARTKSFGLLSIRERLGLLGGHTDIHSKPASGTTVHLTAPLSLVEESDQKE